MMDRAVFDTNILILYSKGHQESRGIFLNVTERFISLTTWIEFLVGIAMPERPKYKRFLEENFEVILPDFDIADLTIELRRTHKLKLPDATIYATAKSLRAPLVTFNSKDFDAGAPDIYIPREAA